MSDQARTELQELGEFGLIQKLSSSFKNQNTSTLLGIGDDSAIIKPNKEHTVISTDLLIENIHFHLSYTPLKHLGYKAVAVNLSDIYAMNAKPTHITVSLALSNRFSLEALEELYAGIQLACERFGVDLIGGDTSSSNSGLMISITAVGEADIQKVTKRNGAKENDLICVSGDLGGAYIGLQILERERIAFTGNETIQPDLSNYSYILERQLKPEPRQDVIEALEKLGVVPTSMIDVSDGLSSDLMHIAHQSGMGCVIYEEKIPIDYETSRTAEELGLDPLIAALNGGEDYELLFTVSLADYDKIKDEKRIHVIGHITEAAAGYQLIGKGGSQIPLVAQGWNHLK